MASEQQEQAPGLAEVGLELENGHFQTEPEIKTPEPAAQAPRSFVRRYYVDELVKASDLPEARNSFMKHFDVDINPTEIKAEDSGPGAYLRVYYCDFLNDHATTETLNRLTETWKEKQHDSKQFYNWVCSLRPRSKLDSYPMLIMLQEMLKAVLSEKLEVQLSALNEAQEKIDLLDGDTSELTSEISRLEEELSNAQENFANLEERFQNAEEALHEAEIEMEGMQEELQQVHKELEQRELEKKKIQSSMDQTQSQLDVMVTNQAVMKLRATAIENAVSTRRDQLVKWKTTASELLSSGEQQEALPDLKAMAIKVSREVESLLTNQLTTMRYKHILNLDDGDGITDSELQIVLQLSTELVSNILQIPNVYVAELVNDKDKGPSLLVGHTKEKEKEKEPDQRFMYVATSPSNSFLVGQNCPNKSITFNAFRRKKNSLPLHVNIAEEQDAIHFYKDQPDEISDKAQYYAAPMMDHNGSVCGFIAVDTLKMEEENMPDLNESWIQECLQKVAGALSLAVILNKGLADDYEENKGAIYFAKGIVARLAGKASDENGSAPSAPSKKDPLPKFCHSHPYILELARRQRNVFGSFQAEMPQKTYFVPLEQDLVKVKIEDLMSLKKELQEVIFLDPQRRKEIRFLCFFSTCPPESLKVWRTAMVLLSLHGDEVLHPDQKIAWRRIKELLSEDRPTKERIYTLVKEYDPSDVTNVNKSSESRINLGNSLLQTVRTSWLQREGHLSVLLYEWTLLCLFIHRLAVPSFAKH